MVDTHFHRLRVTDIRPETDSCVSIAFAIPAEFADAYRFTQGQHLTLRKVLNDEELRRNYSICSAVDEGEVRIAVKRLIGGKFSSWANSELRVGDSIEIMPPLGGFFTALDAEHSKHYLAVAAGSGITPIMSLLRTTLQREPASCYTLVFGNRNVGSIIFREQLDAVKNRYPERFHLIHILSREKQDIELFNGRIDADKIRALSANLIDMSTVDETFLCGPQAMTEAVRDTLIDSYGMAKTHIHMELFGTIQSAKPLPLKTVAAGPRRSVTIIADGKRTELPLATEGTSILDAALAAGADLPFACKGGVCATCRAKLVEGEVTMDVNYALAESEVAAGFVLTCQSHPVTDRVVVDYDHR